MIVRVDTTNLTRGLDFSVLIQTDKEPTVSLYAFNSASHEVEVLDFTIVQSGVFYKALSKSPYFNGYLLAKINNKSILVKKIGNPTLHFLIGYKENYTVPYKLFNEDGIETRKDNFINIVNGFYYCEINSDITIVETLKKRFIVKDLMAKMNYDVTLGDGILQDISLDDITLDATLGDTTLGDVTLQDITLNATLADTNITEY